MVKKYCQNFYILIIVPVRFYLPGASELLRNKARRLAAMSELLERALFVSQQFLFLQLIHALTWSIKHQTRHLGPINLVREQLHR